MYMVSLSSFKIEIKISVRTAAHSGSDECLLNSCCAVQPQMCSSDGLRTLECVPVSKTSLRHAAARRNAPRLPRAIVGSYHAILRD